MHKKQLKELLGCKPLEEDIEDRLKPGLKVIRIKVSEKTLWIPKNWNEIFDESVSWLERNGYAGVKIVERNDILAISHNANIP